MFIRLKRLQIDIQIFKNENALLGIWPCHTFRQVYVKIDQKKKTGTQKRTG